ncbi:MAG: AAA family ATPase [Clostridia bacterium]|nr:AAA family ATPase [Clostridia bacterium]
MSIEALTGREEEIRRLTQCMNETNAQLVVLYGRRRVGKTFLVNEFFDGRFDFLLTGVYNEKKEVQLRHFAEELASHLRAEVPIPRDWSEAFHLLEEYLSSLPAEEKKVVFFDEMPWLDTKMSDFLPAFEYFWNHYGALTHHLVFIVCGSASAWMTKNIDKNKGGLFHRKTCSLFLEPFSLHQTEQYLLSRGISWSRYDIAECYMILGGIPYYLSLLTSEKSLHDNIDNLFFRKRAELWDEFAQLYRTIFSSHESYIRIVEALSSRRHGLQRNEIAAKARIADNGKLSEMLENLVNSDFVRIEAIFQGRKSELRYQLRDYYTWFYFKFIKDYPGRDEHFWRNSYQSPAKIAWCGLTFEQLCKDHIPQIKQKLGIAGVLSESSSWQTHGDEESDGAQVDLLIDRKDHVINLCEIKYSLNQFVIDKDYDLELRNKIGAFLRATKTTKNIQNTMITTYGVKQNKYSSLINTQVTLDDLFSPSL